MNQNTNDIAKMLNCDLAVALEVQDAIDDDNLINWSEDSAKKINKMVLLVARELNVLSSKNLVFQS